LRGNPLRIGILILMTSVMAVNLALWWPDPYKIGRFFVILMSIATSVGIILGLFFHQRASCLICPVGSLIKWTSRSARTLKIDSEQCVECKLCFKVCPVQIKPYAYKGKDIQAVRDADCLKCGLCVSICPKKALSL